MAPYRITRHCPDRSSTVAALPRNKGAVIPLHDENSTELTPVVTVMSIAACVLILLYQISLQAMTIPSSSSTGRSRLLYSDKQASQKQM